MFKLNDRDWKLISQLLTPSWISGLVAIVVGMVISVGVLVTFELNNSALQQQLVAWQSTKPAPALTQPGQSVPENDKPTLKGSWPLLLFWSGAGLIVYFIAMGVIHNLTRAEELRESLGYVNARPERTVAETAEHLVLRLVAFVFLVILMVIFVKRIIPYSITIVHASASDLFSGYGVGYLLLAFALIVVSMHIQVIFLRLSAGRTRILTGA